MPRFYFDVIDGTGFTEDEEGQDLSDAPTARDVAIREVRSILRDDVIAGFIDFAGRIDVSDADRQTLFTIPFGEAVEVRNRNFARYALIKKLLLIMCAMMSAPRRKSSFVP